MTTTHPTQMLIKYWPLLLLFFVSCAKEEEFDGPALIDIFGDFTVINDFQASANSVNFAEGQTVTFTALFSKNVNWTITITGESSGAIRQITGFSNELNASNARWNGTATILPMFRAENCSAVLTFANEEEIFQAEVEVIEPKTYPGLLLSDFEDGFPEGWVPFIQSGANMSFVVATVDIAGQGNSYYDMGGTVNWDYLIGMFDIPGSVYGDGSTFPLANNPNNVFFNCLLYNPPAVNNAITLIQFREDDNGNGTHEANEDLWAIEVTGLAPGWHLISRRYSDLPTLINGQPAAPLGNGIHEPNRLIQVSVLFLANPVTGYSQNYLDYLIFTENTPLQP